MAISSDKLVFEVMEVEQEPELMIFAEDQQDQSMFSLDIDLRNNMKNMKNNHNRNHSIYRKNNQNINNLNGNKKHINKRLKASRIEVVVRKRPMNSREIENNETDIGKVYKPENRITICEPRLKVDLTKFTQYHEFKFDHCFDENVSNKEIYEICVAPLFNTIFNGGKATCFGYGQTGSGKTYTLLGTHDNKTCEYMEGLYAMAVYDLFKYAPINNEIIVSFYEIYGGKLYDLLSDRKQILCREDGKQRVNIIGLKRIKCASSEFLMNIINKGNTIRQTGSTGANNKSSRSHAILSMDILPIGGRLSFIDLAGSERGADTQNNNKQTRIEGAEINKSLLALKECIRALDQNSIHKPFRGSKLTQVLKESFLGNSRTLMIANISPNSGSCENTLNTLRYAYRVKELKNAITDNTTNNHQNNTCNAMHMLRNRSEPNLPIYKNISRPLTANKLNKINKGNKGNKGNKSKRCNQNNNRKKKRKLQQEIIPALNNNKNNNSNNNNNNNNMPQRQIKKPSPPKFTKNGVFIKNKNKNKNQNERNIEKNKIVTRNNNNINNCNNNIFNTTFTKKQLIKAHRKHIDEFMILIKEDMQLLKGFDKDEFDNNNYQTKLRNVLDRQANAVKKYKAKIFNNN